MEDSLPNEEISNSSLHIPEIFTHSFSKDQLLAKYQAILGSYSSSDFETAWTDYFQLVIEPCGWIAVWFPSQETADYYQAGSTEACIVEVIDVDTLELRVEVEMLRSPQAWQEETKQFSVPIPEIFPVKYQENDHLNIDITSEAFELYRNFYKNLWFPWDEASPKDDWLGHHLHNRLNLATDLRYKTGDFVTALRLKNLASETRSTSAEITSLEDTAALEDDDSVVEELVGRIGQLHLRTQEIRREAEQLEDPLQRQLLRISKQKRRGAGEGSVDQPSTILVWREGTLQDMQNAVTLLIGGDQPACGQLLVVPELEEGLDQALPGDSVCLASQGPHQLRSVIELTGREGRLAGLNATERPRLTSSMGSQVFMVVQGAFLLQNLILDLHSGFDVGILLRGGSLIMKNVTIKNCGVGVSVVAGAGDRLIMDSCTIQHCKTGILRSSKNTTSIELKETKIQDCEAEERVYDEPTTTVVTDDAEDHRVDDDHRPGGGMNQSTLEILLSKGNRVAKFLDLSEDGRPPSSSSTPRVENDRLSLLKLDSSLEELNEAHTAGSVSLSSTADDSDLTPASCDLTPSSCHLTSGSSHLTPAAAYESGPIPTRTADEDALKAVAQEN